METIASWIDHCRTALDSAGLHFGHGTGSAPDEAVWLVLAATGNPTDGSFENWEAPVSERAAARIRTLLGERINRRMPLAYLLGEAWFCGLRFTVNRDVLIPRSPIAELIRNRFTPWMRPDAARNALDLCTGSGCIAVSMAIHLPGLRVDASDISRAALAVARANVALHGLENRVRLVRSDLFAGLDGRHYDLIVSNPPYVPDALVAALPPEYRREPSAGLAAGGDGLHFALEIIAQAADHLSDEGVLFCEVGESAAALEEVLPATPFTWVEFEHGGEGVFTMTRKELLAARPAAGQAMEIRKNVV